MFARLTCGLAMSGPREALVGLLLTEREAQILTALAGGIASFEEAPSETSDCIESLYTKLEMLIGHTRPEGETFHTLFVADHDGVQCRQ